MWEELCQEGLGRGGDGKAETGGWSQSLMAIKRPPSPHSPTEDQSKLRQTDRQTELPRLVESEVTTRIFP